MQKFFLANSFTSVSLSIAIVCVCAVFSSCDRKVSSPMVVAVNGEKITEADVNFLLERTFKPSTDMPTDAALREKVVESLIASRAMQQSVKKTMSVDEVERIAQAVKAYEEELYVKEYLQKHVTPEPVTQEQVQEYYDKHPELFGAKYERDFELLKAPTSLGDKQRDQLLAAVTTIRSTSNWLSASKVWQQEYNLQYLQGRSTSGLLHKTIEQALGGLKKGETSDVLYVDGQLHLIRVINITQTPAKPVSEVGADIRKKLAPLLLRDAVKKVSDEVRASAKVEFPSKPH